MKSMHHTFDIYLAEKYGIVEAVLIHHFQHWIRINKKRNKNFKDGRTWSYQSVNKILDHFPYLTEDLIREALIRLSDGKSRKAAVESEIKFDPVLVKGNYNKTSFDKTLWYAFVDEEKFIEDSNNSYEREIPISKKETPISKKEIPEPIPDTKTNAKEKAASGLPKIDPLKFEHEIYQNDKKLYEKVIEWYSMKYAKKPPKSQLAVLKSCIKNKWYEEEVEEAKQNQQERDLNVKFAHEVEKRYQKTDRPPLSDFKALKSGIVFIAGAKEVTIPSYDMPHEIFKKMIKDIFESRGIWEDLKNVKL